MVLGRKACQTPPGGGIPYNGLYHGVVLPEFDRDTLFGLQVYERIEIPLAGKSVFSVSEKAQMGPVAFYVCEKVEKRSGIVFYSYFSLRASSLRRFGVGAGKGAFNYFSGI